jgi:hypothetical protein
MNGNPSSSCSSTNNVEGADLGRAGGGPAGGYAGGAEGTPPVSNTGGKLTVGDSAEVKVDWFTGVYPAALRPLVVAKLSEVMGEGEETERGLNLYRQAVRWATGAVLAFSDDGLNADTCCLVLSGSVVDYFTPDAFREFLRWTHKVGGHCTRLDAAFDDLSREVLRLEDVHAAADAGNFSGFKVHQSQQIKTRRGVLKSDGHTFGVRGKNGAGRLVQFYDKALESDGERDCVRMEVRYAKDHAQAAFLMLVLAESLDVFTSQLCAIIGGSINFLDRSDGETHLDRCAPLPWWSALLKLLGSARVVVRREAPPLQRSLEYLRDAWSLNLALAFEVAESQGLNGDEVLAQLVRLMVLAGKLKLDAGKKPGVKGLGLDIPRLLCA